MTTTQVSHTIDCDDARRVALKAEAVAASIPDLLKDFAGGHKTNAHTASMLRELTMAADGCDELAEI